MQVDGKRWPPRGRGRIFAHGIGTVGRGDRVARQSFLDGIQMVTSKTALRLLQFISVPMKVPQLLIPHVFKT
jgi:hypothetical protein